MQVSVQYLGGVDSTAEMKGLRKEKGMPEGMRWESEMPGSLRGPGRRGPLEAQVILEGKEGSLLPFSAKSVIFLSLECHRRQARNLKFPTAFTAPGP